MYTNQLATRLLMPCTLPIDTAIHRGKSVKRSESLRMLISTSLPGEIRIHNSARQPSELHMRFESVIGLSMYSSWILGLSCLYVGPSTLSHFEPYFRATTFSCMCCLQDGNLKSAVIETRMLAHAGVGERPLPPLCLR